MRTITQLYQLLWEEIKDNPLDDFSLIWSTNYLELDGKISKKEEDRLDNHIIAHRGTKLPKIFVKEQLTRPEAENK